MRYQIATYPNGWTLTTHVQQRMDEMGLTSKHVFEILKTASLVYPGHPGPNASPRLVHVEGPLAVISDPSRRVVITVLWNGAEGRGACGRAA